MGAELRRTMREEKNERTGRAAGKEVGEDWV
jgi:hypothetical protein